MYTEREVAEQNRYLTLIQYTDAGLTSPDIDSVAPGQAPFEKPARVLMFKSFA